ncbi:VRK1 family protein [Megaselia abdita]
MPPKTAAGKKPAPKKKNGYVMPEKIPMNEILTDLSKQSWKIGPSIGSGGFGEIYSATKANNPAKKVEDYEYVVKIEPHLNGPLFVEMHFYLRNGKQEEINKFAKSKGLKSFGMPHFVGSGSHELNKQKHRFLVMPRYGRDIWSFFLENGKKLPEHTIYRLAVQMLDVYEYIHNCTYVHGDLKGANMLLGLGKSGQSQVYLVDFGLAAHHTTKEFKSDPKKSHNGTIEYTSRDAHLGIPTMRGDMEILGYNLIHWSGVTLPWEDEKLLSNPVKVQQSKEGFMNKITEGLKNLFSKNVPEPISQFMTYVSKLEYNQAPDYDKCRKMFLAGLKAMGKSNSGDLDFKLKGTKTPVKTPETKKSKKRPTPPEDESDDSSPPKRGKVGTSTKATTKTKTPEPKRSPIKDQKKRGAKEESEIEISPSPKTRKAKENTSPALRTRSAANTPITAKANLAFSPRVKINTKASTPSSARRPGKTVINDNLTPQPKSSKTYEFNFELDVSMDANVIVNVKRKKKRDTDSNSDTPEARVSVVKKGSSSDERTPKKVRSK